MFRLLIVDDEKFIRDGLQTLINWEEYGIEIAGEAGDGTEALDFIVENRPEIVICDVRMPVMNGLELIKKATERSFECKFIILSGYNDFEYVKEALKHGVENYLLKPVDKEELTQTIEQLVNKLGQKEIYRGMSDLDKLVIEDNILNRMISNNIDYKEFRQKTELIGLELLDADLQVAVIDTGFLSYEDLGYLYKDKNHLVDKNEKRELKTKVYEVGTNVIDFEIGLVFMDMDGRTVIIFKDTLADVLGLLKEIYNSIREISSLPVTVTAGRKIGNYKNLYMSYRQALAIQDYKIVKRSSPIIFYEEIIEKREKSYAKEIEVDYEIIINYLKSHNHKKLKNYIDDLFNRAMEVKNIAPGSIYYMAVEIIICCFRTVRETGGDVTGIIDKPDSMFKYIFQIKDIHNLQERILDIIDKTVKKIKQLNQKEYSEIVASIISYVQEHYDRELSLSCLATEFYFNSAYMGTKFREETGEYFSDYVNTIRINRAKELLVESPRKAKDIAELVGFSNCNYFYRVFKNYAGVTPTEYRESQ